MCIQALSRQNWQEQLTRGCHQAKIHKYINAAEGPYLLS